MKNILHLSRARKLTALALFLFTVLLSSACGATATPSADYRPAAQATIAHAAPAPTAAPAAVQAPNASAPTAVAQRSGESGGPSSAAPIDRRIIKNAQLGMVVENIDVAMMRITGIASDVGGYLVSSRTYVEGAPNSGRRGGQATIAVPVDRYEEALNLVRRVAYAIETDTSSSADVTEQFTDLQSRLRNLEATAARIREFLGKANTVEEALKINAQLSEVDRQIEEIKGKLNAMTARTTFSTITVDMRQLLPTPTPTATPIATPTATPSPTPVPNAWHPDETFTTAVDFQIGMFTALMRTVGDFLIWFIVVVFPYLLITILIVWVVRGFLRWLESILRTPQS